MDINDKNDAPMGWRNKMNLAEEVDAAITFQGAKGYGGGGSNAIARERLIGNSINYTRPLIRPLLKNDAWSKTAVYEK